MQTIRIYLLSNVICASVLGRTRFAPEEPRLNGVIERTIIAMLCVTPKIFDVTCVRFLALAAMLSFILFTPVAAENFKKGMDAYSAGDYATALQELRPLAEQGDVEAQFSLGQMYRKGKGVLPDYVQATKWFRLAAKQGHASSRSILDSLSVQQMEMD